MSSSDNNDVNAFGYIPSKPAAIAFITLFALITLVHLGLVVRSRIWWLIILPIGGTGEVVGWIGRLLAHPDPTNISTYLLQNILLVLTPNFFTAAAYGVFGMVVRVQPQYSSLRPWTYLAIFSTLDILALAIQSAGGGQAATALQKGTSSLTGTHIYVAGIAFQLATMACFVVLALDYFRRARRGDTSAEKDVLTAAGSRLRLLSAGTVVAMLMLFIRGIYRTIELAQGWTGYLITHEPYFLGFDAVTMWICLVAFAVAHPGHTLPSASSGAAGARRTSLGRTDSDTTRVEARASVADGEKEPEAV